MPDFLDFLLRYIAPVLVGGLLGVVGSLLASGRTARSNERIASVKRADQDRLERVNSNLSHADDLTQRFKVLMDGYEGRISDLTDEVKGLRTQVAQMSDQLKKCTTCPYFHAAGHDGTD